METEKDLAIYLPFRVFLMRKKRVTILNQQFKANFLGRFSKQLQELPAQAFYLHVWVDDQIIIFVEFEDIGNKVHGVVFDVNLEVKQGRETVLFLMDAVDLL